MKLKTARFAKSVAVGLVLAQWFVSLPSLAIASNRKDASESFSAEVSRILSVLENRVEDRPLLERTKDKLLTLDRKQIRLIASLSEIVKGNTAGSEIAFLLMTALITLI